MGEKKEKTERRRGGRGKERKKKEGGGWVQGGRAAWVLTQRRAGLHTNNARST